MNDNRFLLTFTEESSEGYGVNTYNWYSSEEEMKEDIRNNPEWTDLEATEILTCREIEV